MAENEAGAIPAPVGPPPGAADAPPAAVINPMQAGHAVTAVCGAKTRSGGVCGAFPMANGRCRMHGGASHPGGPGHPAMTAGGRYSKFLPPRLKERYEEAADDPSILSAREDVALLQARIAELTAKLYTGEADRVWLDLRRAWRAFERVNGQRNQAVLCHDDDAVTELTPQYLEALAEVKRLVNLGAGDAETWRELLHVMRDKTRLQKTEWNRLVDLRQLITVEQAMTFASTLLHAVVRHVDDPATRARINRDFQEALSAAGPAALVQPDGADVGGPG